MQINTRASAVMSGRLWRGIAQAGAVALAMCAGSTGVQAGAAGAPARAWVRSAAPFTETMANMRQRDMVRGSASVVGGGRAPAPSRISSAGGAHGPRLVTAGGASGPMTVGASFAGIDLADVMNQLAITVIPPDTMGAIGPDYFVEAINGGVSVYQRNGTAVSFVSLESFFAAGLHPYGAPFDPQILYDQRSGRWFATTIESNAGANNAIILAVSSSADPTGGWTKYVLSVGTASAFTDFDGLGADDNGVYIGMVMSDATGIHPRIVAMPKAPLLTASAVAVTSFNNLSGFRHTPMPAYNLDGVSGDGPAWFVGASASGTSSIAYCTLTWSGGVPTLSSITDLATTAYAAPISAPSAGSAVSVDVQNDRPFQAMIRGGKLWTARNVGVNANGEAASADRTGAEWLALTLSSGAATLDQSGRVYDQAGSNPRSYYYPTIVASGQGHAAMGFSGSSAAEYIGAYGCARLATDAAGTMHSVFPLKAGGAEYLRTDGSGRNRWGNYSHTSLDPRDDMTIWTIQEYATGSVDIWGTWITSLVAPAPSLSAPADVLEAGLGQNSVTLWFDGAGFYDPGAGYSGRFSAAISGDGISNVAGNYASPTGMSLVFDVAAGATPGLRNVTVTNPDGQTSTVTGAIRVGQINTELAVDAISGTVNQTVSLTATLKRTSSGAGLAGRTVRFKLDGATLATETTDGSGVAKHSLFLDDTRGAGSFGITAEYDGETAYKSCTGSSTLTVGKANFGFSLYAVGGARNTTVNLRSLMVGSGIAVVGRTVEFKVDDTVVGTAVSTATGVTLAYLIPLSTAYGVHNVTVTFAGDSAYNSNTRTSAVLTVKADVGFSLYAASGVQGQAVTLKSLMISQGVAVVGKTVTFQVDGTTIGTAASTASGVQRSYSVPSGMSVGVHSVTVSFAGDSLLNPATRTSSVLTVRAPVAFSLYAASGAQGTGVTLKTLMLSAGSAVIGRTVTFSVDGTVVGTATSDATGAARAYTIPAAMTVGTHNVTVSFAGDSTYAPGTKTSAVLTVSAPKANIAFSMFAATGAPGATVTLKTLVLSGGVAVSGLTISFAVDGTTVGTATSTSTGAERSWTIPAGFSLGTHNLTVSFAGNASYNSATRTSAVIDVLTPKLNVGLSLYAVKGAAGATVTLKTLVMSGGSAVSGLSIAFQVDGVSAGSGTSDATGASVSYTIPGGMATGTHNVTVTFAGDATYNSATRTTAALTVL